GRRRSWTGVGARRGGERERAGLDPTQSRRGKAWPPLASLRSQLPGPGPGASLPAAEEELPEPFEHLLQRIARRPKPQQFFGLMGKRDADSSIEKQVALLKALYGHGQISHKRHKTDSFVGLMGKRALNSVAYERSAMQNYERRRK
uniref:Protachykinin-1 n=1 Tax=Equus caballus TaxID=9796 RepID=A0A9L0SDZ9_HORSE